MFSDVTTIDLIPLRRYKSNGFILFFEIYSAENLTGAESIPAPIKLGNMTSILLKAKYAT
jgi:hypothetical protein